MFCPYCGKETSEGYKYCQHCGKLQPAASQPSPIQTTSVESRPQIEKKINDPGKIASSQVAGGKKRKTNLAVIIAVLIIIAVAAVIGWRFFSAHGVSGSSTSDKGAAQTSNIPLSILNTNLNDVTAGNSIVMQLGALGGTPPYTWGVVSGNLPPGLNLDTTTGRITGVPTQAGQSPITFTLTDKTGTSVASNNLSWKVNASLPILTTTPGQGMTQEQADLNALQNEKTVQYSPKRYSAQQYGVNNWPGLDWQGSLGPAWADIDYVGLSSVTSAYFPIPDLFQNQSLYIIPMVQGDPLQLPWTFTATGLPKGVTCDSATGVIQGKLSGTPVGTYKVEVFFKDAAGDEASFGFPITIISSKPANISNGGSQSAGGDGTLSVSTSNNGSLYVDGTYIGQGIAVVTLAPGEYTLTCEDSTSGGILWEKTISIDAGKTTTVTVN
jgi:hypothetical protein